MWAVILVIGSAECAGRFEAGEDLGTDACSLTWFYVGYFGAYAEDCAGYFVSGVYDSERVITGCKYAV